MSLIGTVGVMDDQLRDEPSDAQEEDPGWPVGFLLFSGLVAVYLIVRFVQLCARFFDWLS